MITDLYETIMLDLEFLHGGRFPQCRARIDRRFAGHHTVQFMAAGALAYACDGRASRLEGAWCWGTPHGPHLRYGPADPDGSWDHRYVAVVGPLADRWAAEGLFLSEPQPTPDPAGFARGMDRMLDLFHRGAVQLAANQLERLLLELQEARSGAAGDEALAAAIAAAGDPERAYRLADLARLAHCSVVHLRRRFVAATGQPPARYARAARLRRARALLAEGDQPVKVIAEVLGFTDVQHFTRCFTAAAGVPPAAYRRQALRGGEETPGNAGVSPA